MYNEAATPKGSGLATASLVLGILAVVLGVVGIGGLLGLFAIIFGAISHKSNKGKSLTGIITGTIGILLSIAALVFIFVTTIDELQTSQPDPGDSQATQRDAEDPQASLRDSGRMNDVAILQSNINHYMSRNRGALPDINTINSAPHELRIITESVDGTTGIEPTTTRVVYKKELDCDNTPGAYNFSLTVLLENGDKHCIGS